jgi:DNA-binding GntR family transcriptional regulator
MSTELSPTRIDIDRLPASRSETAHAYVRETLRRDILNGKLLGGTRLGQTDIAKRLGVSTTPVREALRDLASEGLVVIDPHRGGFVQELNREDVIEAYQIRQQLEPMALKFAMPLITDEDIERIVQINDDLGAAPHTAAWIQLNNSFHMAIYEPSKRMRPRLVSIIGSLHDATVMAVGARLAHTSGVREEAHEEHSQLIEAIRRRDLDEALRVLEHHLSSPISE